jgi:hypothetical protein
VLELIAGQAQGLGVLEGAVVELVLVPASTGEDTP